MSCTFSRKHRKHNTKYYNDFVNPVQTQFSESSSKLSDEKDKKKKITIFCPHCDKTFASMTTTEDMITYHMLQTSGHKDLQQCYNCLKYFVSLDAMNKHLQEVSLT